MAAARVLAIGELVENILIRLHQCDGFDCDLPARGADVDQFHRTHHDPSLVSCLRVNHLWFQISKHILWANIPSIQFFSRIKRERRQIYANSVKSLQVCLPHITYGKHKTDKSGHRIKVHLGNIRRLSFPKLQRLYIVVCTDSPQLSMFSSLPLTAENVFILFAYDDASYRAKVKEIQEQRLDLDWDDPVEDYDFMPPNEQGQTESLGPQFETMVSHIAQFRSLKGLTMLHCPERDEKVIWDCILKMPQLELLEINLSQGLNFDRQFPNPGQPYLSRLKSLRVDFLALQNVAALLRHTHALEVVHLRIYYSERRLSEDHFTDLWELLSQNENLRHLHVWFALSSLDLFKPKANLRLKEESLMLFSERCKSLSRFALYGVEEIAVDQADTVFDDDTLFEFSRRLPKMEVFILPLSLRNVTHQSLLSFSKHWPRLMRLDIHTFLDLGQLAECDFLMPNLEQLHIAIPAIIATQSGQPDYSASAWTNVLNDLCPKLDEVFLHSAGDYKTLYGPFACPEIECFLKGGAAALWSDSDGGSDDLDFYSHDVDEDVWDDMDSDEFPNNEEAMEEVLGYHQTGVPEWAEYQYGHD